LEDASLHIFANEVRRQAKAAYFISLTRNLRSWLATSDQDFGCAAALTISGPR
jgi:hypothetical protein